MRFTAIPQFKLFDNIICYFCIYTRKSVQIYISTFTSLHIHVSVFIHCSLAEHTRVKFIPLYSPVKPRIRTCHTRFTKEEEVKFQRRLEEGYDLEGDMQYNLWKDMHLQEPERFRSFFWSLY